MAETRIGDTSTHIYSRKFGVALTLEAFRSEQNSGGQSVVLILSEGWYSDPGMIEPIRDSILLPLLRHGYHVFAVTHGSNPLFNMADAISDVHAAVKFIKSEAKAFSIDPDRIGVMGWSAGGQLALSLACQAGMAEAADEGDNNISSKIAACAAYFPIADFLDWDGEGAEMLGNHPAVPLHGAFAFRTLDETKQRFTDDDATTIRDMARALSPLNWPSAHQAPCCIITGDKDVVVPPIQSEKLARKMKAVGGTHRLHAIPDGTHDMDTVAANLGLAVNWFDDYL